MRKNFSSEPFSSEPSFIDGDEWFDVGTDEKVIELEEINLAIERISLMYTDLIALREKIVKDSCKRNVKLPRAVNNRDGFIPKKKKDDGDEDLRYRKGWSVPHKKISLIEMVIILVMR